MEFHRSKDAETNKRDRLPDGERVELAALWVAELYPPSQVKTLMQGLRSLGWERSRSSKGGDDVIEWIKDSRAQSGIRHMPIGLVVPPGSKLFMPSHFTALPPGVQAAWPSIYSFTTGLTALIIMLVFDDTAAGEINGVLTENYKTQLGPVRRQVGNVRGLRKFWRIYVHRGDYPMMSSYAVHDPPNQRRTDARRTLELRRDQAAKWIRDNVPGAFTSNEHSGGLPAIQLLVTERYSPASGANWAPAFNHLGLGSFGPIYTDARDEFLRMVLPQFAEGGSKTLTFACRRSEVFPDQNDRERSNWALPQRLNWSVPGLLARWAHGQLLSEHRQRLTRLRDLVSNTSRSRRPLRDIRRMRGLLVNEAFDAQVAAREIQRFATNEHQFAWESMDLRERHESNGVVSDERFVEQMRQWQLDEAQRLSDDVSLAMETMSTDSNLAGVASNIRIQWTVLVIALLSLLVAIWAAWKADVDASDDSTQRPQIVEVGHWGLLP